MKRLLILMTLSGFAMACGDDDGDDPKPTTDGGQDAGKDGGGDAGKDGGGIDASMLTAKVTNTGAACTMNSQCTGPAASCASVTPIGQAFPGGYCSATCSDDAECGSTGLCPVGEVISIVGAGNPALMGITAGQCWEKCTVPGTVSNCRAGYACVTLGALFMNSTPLPALMAPVCLPVPPSGDGGVGDASVVDASGIDASN